MQKTKIEIIEETTNFYNLTNRAINQNGDCVYKTEDGKMCAIGRCLKDEFKIKSNVEYSVSELFRDNKNVDSVFLKEEYQGYSLEFWIDLQDFHDSNYNFTSEGLSKSGLMNKKMLIDLCE